MTTVVIVIHLMVVIAMIGLVLLQRSEGGALGIGGGQGAFMSGRGAANVLTRTTAVLAIAFFATSLGLALLAKFESRPSDILERLPSSAPSETQAPTPPAPTGAPTSAQDLLNQLGGAGGPQTPPAETAPTGGDAAAPDATTSGAGPASESGSAPAEAPAPATSAPPAADSAPAPAAGESAPAVPPAASDGTPTPANPPAPAQ